LGAFFLQNKISSRYIVMIVLNKNQDEPITIIPTFNVNGVALMFEFTDETTKLVYTREPLSFGFSFDLATYSVITSNFLKENTFYNLKVYMRDDVFTTVYKDRVFCIADDTTIQDYSINQGEYTLPNIDNNFYKI
jgi:hypothetical protein